MQAAQPVRDSSTQLPVRPRALQNGGPQPTESIHARVEPQRILRLLEYLIAPGQSNDEGLRRSLVGRAEFPWGTLTATIVDSLDARQEDLLQLARRQPGVWIANPDAMRGGVTSPVTLRRDTQPVARRSHMDTPPAPLDLGTSVPRSVLDLAHAITNLGGYKLAYTLALALDNIAIELAETNEPEKFLTGDACNELAQAFMQQIPPDWAGDAAEAVAPEPDDEERARARERVRAAQEGSQPTAAPWVDPTTRGVTKL